MAADLLGPSEVCELLEVSPMTLKRYRDAGGFPAPVAELSIGAVWAAEDVRQWHEDRTRDAHAQKDKAAERRADAVRTYRRLGNVSETARTIGASRSSVIAWLRAAGELG
jgi:predicted DNA-binding transcriptional regulator AlpA